MQALRKHFAVGITTILSKIKFVAQQCKIYFYYVVIPIGVYFFSESQKPSRIPSALIVSSF